MSEANFKTLISKFGEAVGIKELETDQDNYCCLGFGDKIIVHVQYEENTQSLILFSPLGIVNHGYEKIIFPKLLQSNALWKDTAGATISLDDDTNEVILAIQFPTQSLEFTQFQEILETFIKTSEHFIDSIESVLSGNPWPEITYHKLEKDNKPKKGEEPPSFPGAIRA